MGFLFYKLDKKVKSDHIWLDFQIHFKVAIGFEIKEDEKRLSSKIMGENFISYMIKVLRSSLILFFGTRLHLCHLF